MTVKWVKRLTTTGLGIGHRFDSRWMNFSCYEHKYLFLRNRIVNFGPKLLSLHIHVWRIMLSSVHCLECHKLYVCVSNKIQSIQLDTQTINKKAIIWEFKMQWLTWVRNGFCDKWLNAFCITSEFQSSPETPHS